MEILTEKNNVLYQLIGREVSSVEFVRDYVQLRFDGIIFTLYKYPVVIINDEQYSISTMRYRDYLCSLINIDVSNFELAEQQHIKLFFSNKTILLVSLCKEECIEPEIAMIKTEDNVIQVW